MLASASKLVIVCPFTTAVIPGLIYMCSGNMATLQSFALIDISSIVPVPVIVVAISQKKAYTTASFCINTDPFTASSSTVRESTEPLSTLNLLFSPLTTTSSKAPERLSVVPLGPFKMTSLKAVDFEPSSSK